MKYIDTLGINCTVLQIRLVIFDPLELSTLCAVHNHRCDTAFCMGASESNKVSSRAFTRHKITLFSSPRNQVHEERWSINNSLQGKFTRMSS